MPHRSLHFKENVREKNVQVRLWLDFSLAHLALQDQNEHREVYFDPSARGLGARKHIPSTNEERYTIAHKHCCFTEWGICQVQAPGANHHLRQVLRMEVPRGRSIQCARPWGVRFTQGVPFVCKGMEF